MQTLTQSAFLQALGYAIAHSLWQTALLWMAVMTLNGLFKFSATTKYRIAVTAQLSGFVWFLITLFFYFKTSSLALAQAEILQASANTVLVPETPPEYENNILAFIVRAEQILPYLSVAYLFLLSFLVIKWIRSYRYTTLIQHNGLHKIDVEWKLFVKKLAAELGIKADVKIYLSEIVTSPLTIGFIKPVILIPVASMNHLTVQQLEAIILHEMAHIRRLDYLINLFVSIIELCLFFNPFTQLISRIIKNERENSCDDWVLQYQYQPAMYAEALLRIAYLQNTPALAMAAAGNKQVLLTRIKRMLDQNQRKFNYRQHLLALLLMTGVLSSLAWYQPVNTNSNTKKTNTHPAVIEPLSVKVDNPLFNPVFFLSKPLKEEVKKAAKDAEKKLREAQIVIRDLHIPSITTIGAEKLRELNVDKMHEDLLRLESNLRLKEKEIASLNNLKLKTWVGTNMTAGNTGFYTDSLIAYNKQLNNLFTAQVPSAPVIVNMEKIGEEMKRVKDAMMKLGKQGLIKFDDKAFEKEFMESFRLMPLLAATMAPEASSDRAIMRWAEAGQIELRKRTEALRDNTEQAEKRRTQFKTVQWHSLRTLNKLKIAAGQNFWMNEGSEDEAPAATSRVPKTSEGVPAPFYKFANSDLMSREKQDLVGPREEVTTPKVVSNMRIPRVASAQGSGVRVAGVPTRSGQTVETIIVSGKQVDAKSVKPGSKKVLRVESF